MAENTRLKELQAEVKKNADIVEKNYTDLQSKIDGMQKANEAKFDEITEALAALLQHHTTSHGSPHVVSNSQKPPFQVRSVKLDFPRFDGSNVRDWIFRAGQFFDYYETPDHDRLTIASVHLDQDVIPWFQMMQKANPFRSWRVFTRALEMDFGPSIYECPRSTLFKLTQTGSVSEFYLEFTALANRVDGLSTDALLDCFLSGLKADICRDVRAMSPTTLAKAVALAKLFEERYEPNSKAKFPNNQAKTSNTSHPYQKYTTNTTKVDNPITNTKANQPPLLPTPPTKPLPQNQKNPKIKYISPAEMQVRRDKGLCYWCDDKFSFTHKCPNKYLMM